MRSLMTCVALLAVAASEQVAAQGANPEPFVERHLTLHVELNFPLKRLSGTATFELENWTTQPAGRVSLTLNRLMEATRVSDGIGNPLVYSQDVRRYEDVPMLQVNQIVVELAGDVAPGARTTIRVDYEGHLVGYTEVGWNYVKDRIDTTFTILRSDARAFPGIEGLNFAANRRGPSAAFTYDAAVRVPSRFVVATAGAATRTSHDDGTVTWRYTSDGPSPFLNIAIASYGSLSEGGIHIFHFHEDSAGARQLMRNAQTAMGTLAEWFGAQRKEVNLAITEIPDGWGSQADLVGGIIQTAAAFKDEKRTGELYHELTHLWNVRDLDTPSPRWNEGLATFLESLLMERVNGWPGRKAYETQYVEYLKKKAATDSGLRSVPFINYGRRGMTGMSYSVGSVMFATLYELLGEAEFNKVIGGYYHGRPGGGTTRDFIAHARRVASRDLSAFFEDWMVTTRWTAVIASAGSTGDLAGHYRVAARTRTEKPPK